MKYVIRHQTAYRYSEPASLSQNELILRPRETPGQKLLDSTITIVPEPRYLRQRTDYFGNEALVFMIQEPHTELVMTAESRVESLSLVPPDPVGSIPWENTVRRLAAHGNQEELSAYQFVFPSPLITPSGPTAEYARPSFDPGKPVLAGAMNLMGRIFNEFTYDKNATTVDTPVERVLVDKKGVCQDFAHLMIGCLRSLGLSARYVSGYLETKPPPGKPKLVGADASHAWVSLYVPDLGWVDLDPTNNILPGENHITLAWGRDYSDVTPVKGVVMGGGRHTLTVNVDVSASP